MILSFKHKGLEKLWMFDDGKLLPRDVLLKIRQMLYILDTLKKFPDDLLVYPNWRLHELKGNRKGIRSIWVKNNWRITFKIKNEIDIYDIDFEDYH
jgi:proteic killer suppression protein